MSDNNDDVLRPPSEDENIIENVDFSVFLDQQTGIGAKQNTHYNNLRIVNKKNLNNQPHKVVKDGQENSNQQQQAKVGGENEKIKL